uniref:xyloglucan endotransglucosylase/hydrolase protein 2-like n=1 Tax=Erigeron canadensis TaxID=72917 RepID=UPI001CB91F27|nr:xyloglucan endotransglucosylase/hydrolase protein 2-like [Erigeron canadensis]
MCINMMSFLPKMMIVLIFFEMFFNVATSQNESIHINYEVSWGRDHISYLKGGQEVQLSLERFSGCGFMSKAYYGSGFFRMMIKVPPKDSAGVVTAFYLHRDIGDVHDELDFEFLGNRPGKKIKLQTNVIINGIGGREQGIYLWFDPTADFHEYRILWNQHQIVFFVDDTPIRIFKNDNYTSVIGYPSLPMQVHISIWNASWATDGGKTKIIWSHSPFQAHFQYFHIDGCPSDQNIPNQDCYSTKYRWNIEKYWQINPRQKKKYDNVRKKYLYYDYCTGKGVTRPECVGHNLTI